MKTSKLKTTLFAAILIFLSKTNYSQLKVINDGSVTINSYTPAWGSAIRATVHDYNACSYHLNYGGSDVFYVHASGYLWAKQGGYFGSDIKFKTNINNINSPLEKVLKLKGIQYDFIEQQESGNKNSNGQRLGFIAQEVEKIVPGVVKTMPDSSKAVAYTDLTALLVEAMKEENTRIVKLEQEISNLKDSLLNLQINNINNENDNISFETNPKLYQNNPNPFREKTIINYDIPKEDFQSASIIVFDMNGILLKRYTINSPGKNSIEIPAKEYKPGMYIYSLILNDKEIDSKRMIILE